MAKTSAENQAAYRQRKAEKLSEESTAEGTTLSPGAACVPEDNGNEIDLSILDPGLDPGLPGIPSDPVIEKLDKLLGLVREIHQHIAQTFVVGSPEPASKPARGGSPAPVGDLTQCMKCEAKLPPTETPRLVRELCHDCVWRKTNKT